MSSALYSAIASVDQNSYVSLAVLTAVGYDYVFIFPDEIEYIWTKPWTWVSTFFIVVRYAGLYCIIIDSLGGISSLPDSIKHSSYLLNSRQIINIICDWVFLLFLAAADLVMILRLWAMYNRSRLILKVLLTLFSLEIVSTLLAAAIYSDSRYQSADAAQILEFSVCVWQPKFLILAEVVVTLQIMHGAAMCILAIAQFARESLQMYRMTKRWQLNRYMSLLVKQGILYFLCVFLVSLIQVLAIWGGFPTGGRQADLLFILEYVPMYTLTPRFILSIRELYAHDVQGRHGDRIDTGFGLSSTGCGAVGTAMVFTDVELNEGSEDVNDLTRDVRTTWAE